MYSNYVYGVSTKPRKVLVYDPNTTPRKCFDGTEYLTFTSKEILDFGLKNSRRSKYIPISKGKDKSLKETYDEFILSAERMKEETKGRINLYKTGTYAKTALSLFFSMMNLLGNVPDKITEKEAQFLYKTNQGAIIYSNKIVYTGEGHIYDVNNFYASIMKSVNFRVPIKEGTFRTLSEDEFKKMQETYFLYGIYRVIIKNTIKTRKLFRKNVDNYYTSIDLNVAKSLGLKMKLITDGEDNFLSYGSGTCLSGSTIFKPFVDYLTNLKKVTNNKIYKVILNSLWGALSQFAKVPKPLIYDVTRDFAYGKIFAQKKDVMIIKEGFTNFPNWKVDFLFKSRIYKYNWARIKPFMLAKGRETIGRLIKPHLQHIRRIHTDGFISDKKLDVKIGNDIGELRYEGFKRRITITHVNSVLDWDDKDDFMKVLYYYSLF